MSVLDFFKMSPPSERKVPVEKQDSYYKRLRLQIFLMVTFSYAMYYVCRLSLGVMKQPIIDAGLLSASQLGIIGACLYWSYAIGKCVSGFLADRSNIKRFMATGLVVSLLVNFFMGLIGASASNVGQTSMLIAAVFAIMWGINGFAQSMGAPPAIVSLSRWFPLKIRGTFFGFFSASHNLGEGMSFVFVGSIVAAMGWKWGFFGATIAGIIGVLLILFFVHDTPESKGLPPIEVLAKEKAPEKVIVDPAVQQAETKRVQQAVLRNPGVWVLALASAFMYMSRYAINEWGTIFLQEARGYSLKEAATIIGVNPIFGIIGAVSSGWLSDILFKGDRKYPALVAGILEIISLYLFLFCATSKTLIIISMILFGIAIGMLISYLGGLMAIDIVPRRAAGAALGTVGIASYIAAGIQNVITGILLDGHICEKVNEMGEKVQVHDFTMVSYFWLGAAVISCILPLLNWNRKQQEI